VSQHLQPRIKQSVETEQESVDRVPTVIVARVKP